MTAPVLLQNPLPVCKSSSPPVDHKRASCIYIYAWCAHKRRQQTGAFVRFARARLNKHLQCLLRSVARSNIFVILIEACILAESMLVQDSLVLLCGSHGLMGALQPTQLCLHIRCFQQS